jgi:hypothetical protein
MSSTLSYLHAKNLLSEVEKDRIVCTYLNSTEPNAVSIKFLSPCLSKLNANLLRQVDWDKASSEYGAASVESYKKGMQNTTKKIKKAMESGEPAEATEATPAKKGGAGKKRKEKTAEAEADGEAEESPTKKKKGGRKTKAQKEAEAAAAAEEAEDGVKAEDSE